MRTMPEQHDIYQMNIYEDTPIPAACVAPAAIPEASEQAFNMPGVNCSEIKKQQSREELLRKLHGSKSGKGGGSGKKGLIDSALKGNFDCSGGGVEDKIKRSRMQNSLGTSGMFIKP